MIITYMLNLSIYCQRDSGETSKKVLAFYICDYCSVSIDEDGEIDRVGYAVVALCQEFFSQCVSAAEDEAVLVCTSAR